MSIVDRLPTNKNFLSPAGFRFSIFKTPGVNYFVQAINVPSLTLGETSIPSPFVKIPLAGDHIQYGQLQITFRVDEELKNYKELYDWIYGLGKPKNFDQAKTVYNQPASSGNGAYSDATLAILSSSKNPIVEVNFKNIYPVTLTDIMFDSRVTDVDYIDASCTFNFERFELTWL